MTKCTECKLFTGGAICYNGKHYLICKVEGLIAEDVALDESLDCDLYVEDLDADSEA